MFKYLTRKQMVSAWRRKLAISSTLDNPHDHCARTTSAKDASGPTKTCDGWLNITFDPTPSVHPVEVFPASVVTEPMSESLELTGDTKERTAAQRREFRESAYSFWQEACINGHSSPRLAGRELRTMSPPPTS